MIQNEVEENIKITAELGEYPSNIDQLRAQRIQHGESFMNFFISLKLLYNIYDINLIVFSIMLSAVNFWS